MRHVRHLLKVTRGKRTIARHVLRIDEEIAARWPEGRQLVDPRRLRPLHEVREPSPPPHTRPRREAGWATRMVLAVTAFVLATGLIFRLQTSLG